MPSVHLSVLLILAVTLAGCAPEITNIQVTSAANGDVLHHQEPLRVTSDIIVRRGGAGTPEVAVRPVYPGEGGFVTAGRLPDRVQIGTVDGYDLYRYSGELAGYDYGAYDLRLSVDYREYTVKTQTADTRFFIEAPASCFSFDDGLQGFSLGPVRHSDGREYTHSVPFRRQLLNWPIDAARHGSVSFDITLSHFPSPPAEPRFWFIDFISPDLSADPLWQQSRGLTLRLSTGAGSVYAQPLIKIAGRLFAPKDSATGKFLVYPLRSSSYPPIIWNVITWDAGEGLPQGAREQVLIRIYGDARATGVNNDVTVFLDGVCPVPPGITPPGGAVVAPIPNPWQ
ncbi:hypothetical protein [Geoalkalibacter sp.]|uniref:hypothetical protein n=1 Tax=Geoalkalibacter sp. TaxID=3041440 RepID=UPI00272EB463|nr:hypothetical protein [Geoalkalibacter sp.]